MYRFRELYVSRRSKRTRRVCCGRKEVARGEETRGWWRMLLLVVHASQASRQATFAPGTGENPYRAGAPSPTGADGGLREESSSNAAATIATQLPRDTGAPVLRRRASATAGNTCAAGSRVLPLAGGHLAGRLAAPTSLYDLQNTDQLLRRS